MKSEQLNPYLEMKQRTDRDIRQLGVLASEIYGPVDSTDQQTVINLTFAVNMDHKKQIFVFIDGQKLIEGATGNFQWTNIQSNISNQITLNAPVMAGLPIEVFKMGAYQETLPNPSSVTANILDINTNQTENVNQPHKMALAGFQNFVAKNSNVAPNTQIQNRATIDNALKAIAGIERVVFKSTALIRNEFGSNGEQVFELDNKDSRVRFVGSWTGITGSSGNITRTLTVGDYVEISFYGTGLNLLTFMDNSATPDWRVSINGGAEGSNVYVITSTVLASRNYSMNVPVTVASNLSVGWHTVKIRCAVAGTNGFTLYGMEILNQRTDLAVLSGVAYGGMKQEVLSALSASAFNAGVTGTRGARVVKYIKDNAISQAVTNVNTASAFLTSADHTNEEVVRKINFREFGANRADDFSTIVDVSTNRAFTLDDGTTTLAGSNVLGFTNAGGVDGLDTAATIGSFSALTFVGTGVDVVLRPRLSGAALDTHQIYIDNVLVGTLPTTALTAPILFKICSGLPYGEHTFKIVRTTTPAQTVGIVNLLIYQPKKPSLPSGAVEVVDYNVVANYVASITPPNASIGVISQGVIRKVNTREPLLVGTGWTAFGFTIAPTGFDTGWNLGTAGVGDYIEIPFFGTGCEWKVSSSGAHTPSWTFSIDGSANLTGLATYDTSFTGLTFTPATGTLAGTTQVVTSPKGAVRITGLSLGWHKLKVLNNNGGANPIMYYDCLDVISPIHINNGFKVGNLSLKDSRAFSPVINKPESVDMSKSKAWISFDGVNSKILTSNNISQVIKIAAGQYLIYFDKPFKTKEYVAVGSGYAARMIGFDTTLKTPNYILAYHLNNSVDTGVDVGPVSLVFFGELENEGEI